MKRVKRHKVKSEKPETSTSQLRDPETHDLAFYIHDRVELMHQVFSVLKYKELKSIAPACIRNISIDDLQELCTEELLGISSKRLCAILDGADPPSDTESSSPSPPPENLETISLDSISSDEEILSQASSKKKKHKHRRRDSKSKTKRKRSNDDGDDNQQSRASRAGLTVLELLELQARARAIRAQLQQEQIHKTASETVVADQHQSSESEVEIKEEPPEVVEISSEDEKPVVEELERQMSKEAQSSQPVVKRVNDMVVIAPQKPTQKIKLNRKGKPKEKDTTPTTNNTETVKEKEKDKVEKDKKKKKRKKVRKDYDDTDEITLQLSDTEKMDLLEDLDRKNYDNVSSDSSDTSDDPSPQKIKDKDTQKEVEEVVNEEERGKKEVEVVVNEGKRDNDVELENIKEKDGEIEKDTNSVSKDNDEESVVKDVIIEDGKEMSITEDNQEECVTENLAKNTAKDVEKDEVNIVIKEKEVETLIEVNNEEIEALNIENEIKDTGDAVEKGKDMETEKSEGEISDRDSSEVEVFCISEEEVNKSKKKKKKKDKKVKKARKSSKSDFREGNDENFFKDNEKDLSISVTIDNTDVDLPKGKNIEEINKESRSDDDVQEICEIFELSDDSSICEEILSMDPTTTEIEALSAKIDEIGSEKDKQEDYKDIENISWRDRYLDSKKVKKVLNTANILNALRKKNIELKIKLAENKETEKNKDEEKIEPEIVEGTIDHYNTLEGSTKYVDPILPGDLKKDAKLLLKMYKKLLKYNDMNKDTKKVKKKKKKKRKDSLKDTEKVKDVVNSDS